MILLSFFFACSFPRSQGGTFTTICYLQKWLKSCKSEKKTWSEKKTATYGLKVHVQHTLSLIDDSKYV